MTVTYDNVPHILGDEVLTENCGKRCSCMGQSWDCVPFSCPSGTLCGIDLEGKEECNAIQDCPAGATWTKWTDVDAAENGNDRESAKKARKKYPGFGICTTPLLAEGRMVEEPEKTMHILREEGWFIRSATDRVGTESYKTKKFDTISA